MKTREDGIPWIWVTGGSLSFLLILMVSLVGYVASQGLMAFWPQPLWEIQTTPAQGNKLLPSLIVGQFIKNLPASAPTDANHHDQVLLLQGNRDVHGHEFVMVNQDDFAKATPSQNHWFIERLEWGPFIGTFQGIYRGHRQAEASTWEPLPMESFAAALHEAHDRREAMQGFESREMVPMNRRIEELRLEQNYLERQQMLASAAEAALIEDRLNKNAAELAALVKRYKVVAEDYQKLRDRDDGIFAVLLTPQGDAKKVITLSEITRALRPGRMNILNKTLVFLERIEDFLTEEPREANSAGGILPALFGTAAMTLMMCLVVLPFGVLAAVYMREIAKQGFFVSLVRVAVGNLSGVPSIVFGVFGLGFFCYGLGNKIDQWFFAPRLPTPTFGTGGILWASLTLALLTVPVVIVATEEALASVPRTLREASYGCGATRLQTIWHIVLPKAVPGIMTGLIMAIARGVGEVAPLLLTGVVKLAPELPFDRFFPFVHLERSFMHLAFHIYDLGFQSRSSEESRPMVFASTFVLITMVLILNFAAIKIRSSLRRRFEGRGAF